uniref:Nicastrin n=1 Tax=Anoplophora glabripennis TaxID=217634 RepID=V5GWG1_ANOGL
MPQQTLRLADGRCNRGIYLWHKFYTVCNFRRSNIITNLNPITFCDPLGDNNVWATLYPLVKGPRRNETKPITDFKYIVIATRMDTTSMFEKTSGANNPVTGIVTLLYTAKLLKSMLSEENIQTAKKNVLFILFNGETFDYIGSQRMVYDMERGNFPIKGLEDNNNILPIIRPENISLFIELSQLGNSRDLFVHYLKPTTEIESFYNKLNYNGSYVHFQNVPLSLPPSSLHSFLRNNSDFPGLVIADHERSYTNFFYNSVYDNASNIGYKYYDSESQVNIPEDSIQRFIVNISEIVAKSVYETITGNTYSGEVATDAVLVDELFHCYLEDPNCKIHTATQKIKLSKTPSSLYVGVDRVSNYATTLTSLTLGWFTGIVEGKGDINCTNKPRNYAFHYFNMSKSIYELNVTLCYKVTMNLTEAKSPAFLIEDYDWSSGLYSSWTESVWWEMGARMFLRPSAAHEKMTIAIGSMSMIFSFIVVYFAKTRSHILFTSPLPSEAPADC